MSDESNVPPASAGEPGAVAGAGGPVAGAPWRGRLDDVFSVSGYVLAVSYPLLAFSTGGRALYQLFFKPGGTAHLPALMSGLAALCYLVAAIGFAYRRRWTWWLSVGALSFEMVMVLVVGTLSLVIPAVIGRTVWRHYGEDYGYFPLFQPLLGLGWLFWSATLDAYGIRIRPDRARAGHSVGAS
jgi:hypothetical protein